MSDENNEQTATDAANICIFKKDLDMSMRPATANHFLKYYLS